MYNFPPYWTDKLKIDFLQRVVLIHSYLYYEKSITIWLDKKYDEIAEQLTNIQNKHSEEWIKNKTQYGYVFYDFDGTTGFDLWYRLKNNDKKYINMLSETVLKQ